MPHRDRGNVDYNINVLQDQFTVNTPEVFACGDHSSSVSKRACIKSGLCCWADSQGVLPSSLLLPSPITVGL